MPTDTHPAPADTGTRLIRIDLGLLAAYNRQQPDVGRHRPERVDTRVISPELREATRAAFLAAADAAADEAKPARPPVVAAAPVQQATPPPARAAAKLTMMLKNIGQFGRRSR